MLENLLAWTPDTLFRTSKMPVWGKFGRHRRAAIEIQPKSLCDSGKRKWIIFTVSEAPASLTAIDRSWVSSPPSSVGMNKKLSSFVSSVLRRRRPNERHKCFHYVRLHKISYSPRYCVGCNAYADFPFVMRKLPFLWLAISFCCAHYRRRCRPRAFDRGFPHYYATVSPIPPVHIGWCVLYSSLSSSVSCDRIFISLFCDRQQKSCDGALWLKLLCDTSF